MSGSSTSSRSAGERFRAGFGGVLALALALALLALGSVALAQAPREELLPDDDLVVVRWTTTDLDTVRRLSNRFDLWMVRPQEHVAIFGVTRAEMAEMRAAGIPVVVDEARTAEWRAARLAMRTTDPDCETDPCFSCYRTVEKTYADLAQLAADHPTLAEWKTIGASWEQAEGPNLLADGFESGDACAWMVCETEESCLPATCDLAAGSDIQVLVLGDQTVAGPKAPLVVIAAMHARELATAELVTRFAESLVAADGIDPDVTWILDHTEIHLVPHLNPDGRKQVEGGENLWRKNTNNDHCGDSNSRGVDLNRNSSFQWGGTGSSGSPCSTLYRGPEEASEPETQAIEDYMALVFPDQRGPNLGDAAGVDATGIFLSIHSAVPTILYPWEWNGQLAAPDEPGLRTFGLKLAQRTNYDASQDGLGAADGTTVDEAYGEYGVAAYTIEIGTTFFQSCASFCDTVLPDNLAGLEYAAKAARRPYRAGLGPDVTDVQVTGGGAVDGAVPRGGMVTLQAIADGTLYGPPTGTAAPATPAQIAGARFSVDVPPWVGPTTEMSADDGLFNSTVEPVTGLVSTAGLDPGQHIVYVVARDAEGDEGPPSAVFLEIVAP